MVLLIKPDILWELDCKFIFTNAASCEIKLFADEKWSSAQAFEEMFNSSEYRMNIPEFYTTDPQAEVMVKHKIPREYIQGIAVQSRVDITWLNHLMQIMQTQVEVNPSLFAARKDFEHWHKFWLDAFSGMNNLVSPFTYGHKTCIHTWK